LSQGAAGGAPAAHPKKEKVKKEKDSSNASQYPVEV